MPDNNKEQQRLHEHHFKLKNWKKWGPYLSERSWGNVREDYSPTGDAWNYFPFEHAKSRAYRWNEDGMMGLSDRNQHLCFSISLWNEKDSILKERYFGVNSWQGNHGEDVKEYYYYLDSTPTHSYMKYLYKYPHEAFPYEKLIAENLSRTKDDPEYELADTHIFEKGYFDVFTEYTKENVNDILIKITVHNRGSKAANLHVLPTLWYRNTWSWGYECNLMSETSNKPELKLTHHDKSHAIVKGLHESLGDSYLYAENPIDVFFTENETNHEQLFGSSNTSRYTKDAFHRYLIAKETSAINPLKTGTKAAAHFHFTLNPGEEKVIRLRLCDTIEKHPFADFNKKMQLRIDETNDFYNDLQKENPNAEARMIQRQALAGMLLGKQNYYYDIEQWLKGDPAYPKPDNHRKKIRNHDWEHLVNFDVISMPDKWEYPWYASWDLAFHCIALVLVDSDFAKRQLTLMTREWYMHPNGQLPAYEWCLSDVNPPVHAWAAWRVYKIDAKKHSKRDTDFLKGIFNKLLLNFTWWVNKKDAEGRNVFQGGFLGLDNISLFDRSRPLPLGGFIDQSDGTAWMAFYSLIMMKIALELAKDDPILQDTATKFFEHFLRIAGAMTHMGGESLSLWDSEDGFFYDVLHLPDNTTIPLKVRSLVGLLPLFAVETIEDELLKDMPVFERRMEWFLSKRPDLGNNISCTHAQGVGKRRLMSILVKDRLVSVLKYMLDEKEFLSEYGIRSLSKYHQEHPYEISIDGQHWSIGYEPAESKSAMFGGNSNWRGPIWFPINYLIIESLQKFHHYYGEDLKVEFPTGSGTYMTLDEIATELSNRLIKLFVVDDTGQRPFFGKDTIFNTDPHWKDYILFYEYFNGDNGQGLGASHQTGWTGLIAKLLQ